ncbi:hypothetical protein FQA47_023158 [Oryzias melastigma]|uniref:Uncharacterized protein n=1 Tax=Oryzias melastigma TaxID=30732 RepID=A0A834F017_ORYME|nr:hypothetical protein FQA47_023158 [Oryzias melastigma]
MNLSAFINQITTNKLVEPHSPFSGPPIRAAKLSSSGADADFPLLLLPSSHKLFKSSTSSLSQRERTSVSFTRMSIPKLEEPSVHQLCSKKKENARALIGSTCRTGVFSRMSAGSWKRSATTDRGQSTFRRVCARLTEPSLRCAAQRLRRRSLNCRVRKPAPQSAG